MPDHFPEQYPHIAVPQFIIPVEGEYLKDYFLLYYVDWGVHGISDYKGGNKTYTGHQGTDFIIRNFAQMDAGVAVLAADAGVVTYVLDTVFDRNKRTKAGGLGNYVAIRHANNFYTYYGHLKKGSATVRVGDTVAVGQKIGEVGSSGYSSDPHLHFEVWYNALENWDPFTGFANNPNDFWLETLPYIGHFGAIDHDFTNFVPNLDALKERIPGQRHFSAADPVITFWMQGYGVFPGDVCTLQWFDPEGKLWFQFDYKHKKERWYFYWWSYIEVPPVGKVGLWSVRFLVNGVEKIVDSFSVG